MKGPRGGPRDRGPRGANYDVNAKLVSPVDYLILSGLPREGTLVLGIYPDARTSSQLVEEVFGRKIEAAVLGPRMNFLAWKGYIVRTPTLRRGRHGANAWQLTPEGEEAMKTPEAKAALAEWEAYQKEATDGTDAG
jgi:hypothetical protein